MGQMYFKRYLAKIVVAVSVFIVPSQMALAQSASTQATSGQPVEEQPGEEQSGSGQAASDMASVADGDVEKGRAFAKKNCGRCHALGLDGDSPLKTAPPFRTFGEKWPIDSLAESLAEGIVTGHSDMPEFVLTPDQIGEFLSYLKSLQAE